MDCNPWRAAATVAAACPFLPARAQPRHAMITVIARAAALGLLAGVLAAPNAWGHAVCGDRVFPATLVMDDPGVSDELSLPTIQYLPIPANNGSPAGHSVDYAFEWDKNITRDLGFAINDDYFTQHLNGSKSLDGWDNLTFTLKDQLPCIEDHEFMVSLGVIHTFGGTGSGLLRQNGLIDAAGNTIPTFYVGKGFGDLPDSLPYLKPFAVTGELGYQISDNSSINPNQWDYAASLQYSIPYLNQNIKALNVPDFVRRLVPLVEVSLSSPTTGFTTGTISPGIYYMGQRVQIAAEAMIPANAATRSLQGVGFIVQFHVFLDDLPPGLFTRPLINKDLWKW
jgi:hypothetical protein